MASPVRAALDYHADIAPLLRQYCAGCHNDEDFDGEFSVEYFSDLEEGGSRGVMLRPGNPDESYLIKLMTGGTDEPMPPADDPQPTEADLAIFRQWIEEGARGPESDDDISILSLLEVPDIPAATGQKGITAMGRSADGQRLATARFGSVTVADANGKKLLQLKDLPGKIHSIEFAPNQKDRLVTASGVAGLKGVATLWDGGKAVRAFGEGYHRDVLYDAVLSPDGKLLATGGYDRKIAIWDVATGDRLRTIEIHNGAIFDLDFSPDGSVLASASGDQTVKLWRVSDGERLDTLNQPQGEQYSVSFSPDGRFIFAGGADNRIRMYRFISRDQPKINPMIHSRYGHEDAIVTMVVSDDGKWLATSADDQSVKLWTLPALRQVKAWENQPDIVTSLKFVSDKMLAGGRLDGSEHRWSYEGVRGLSAGPDPVGNKEDEDNRSQPVASAEVAMIEAKEQEGPIEVSLPAEINGAIGAEGDTDTFQFTAKQGEEWVFEVAAARQKSPLDSKLEILNAQGDLLERVKLQAVRDSWFTFRGKNSMQVNDFRVQNWREMELNEYLYCNGEVVKLWLYPRGPDSGFTVYPGYGNRKTYFGTTGQTHALGEPCYIVEPVPEGTDPVPNGLPVYTIYYENDDDPNRRFGSDSYLSFKAPADGTYQVRISDVRGFGGEKFTYQLKARPNQPSFTVKHNINKEKGLKVLPGAGKEFMVTADRFDGFDGPIRVELTGLPEGLSSSPVTIEQGQHRAMALIWADPDAVPLPDSDGDQEKATAAKLVATAMIGKEEVSQELASPGAIVVDSAEPKIKVTILPDGDSGEPTMMPGEPMVLTIRPGETITAMVKAERFGFNDRIDFGKEDAGRNLAHGLIIDNIGLNGLMIPAGATEQRFFITAADWVPESTRTFHLKASQDSGRASQAIVIKVVRDEALADSR